MGRILDISELVLELGLSSTITDEERAIALSALSRAESAVRKHLGYDPVYAQHTEMLPTYGGAYNADSNSWDIQGNQAVSSIALTSGCKRLQLQHLPIRSIVSLHIDTAAYSGTVVDSFAADTLKTEGVDFWPNYDLLDSLGNKVCRDGQLISNGAWPAVVGSVKVVYMAGYLEAELHGQDSILDAQPILEVVLYEAVRRVRRFALSKKSSLGFRAGTILSESLGDYSYSVDGGSASLLLGSGDLTPDSKDKLSTFVRMAYDL
jgi:hypothetical protein